MTKYVYWQPYWNSSAVTGDYIKSWLKNDNFVSDVFNPQQRSAEKGVPNKLSLEEMLKRRVAFKR